MKRGAFDDFIDDSAAVLNETAVSSPANGAELADAIADKTKRRNWKRGSANYKGSRLIKTFCSECGYTARVTAKWLDVGMLCCANKICGKFRRQMVTEDDSTDIQTGE